MASTLTERFLADAPRLPTRRELVGLVVFIPLMVAALWVARDPRFGLIGAVVYCPLFLWRAFAHERRQRWTETLPVEESATIAPLCFLALSLFTPIDLLPTAIISVTAGTSLLIFGFQFSQRAHSAA